MGNVFVKPVFTNRVGVKNYNSGSMVDNNNEDGMGIKGSLRKKPSAKV